MIGWSLGGASALLAMEQTPDIGALVSDSVYANADPLLADNPLRPGLKLAMRLVRDVDLDDVRPDRALVNSGDRPVPVFLIHGADDRAVPLAQFERLRAAAPHRTTETWVVEQAGHVGAYNSAQEEYVERLSRFFDQNLGS